MEKIKRVRIVSAISLALLFIVYYGYFKYLSWSGISADKIMEIYNSNFFLLFFLLGILNFFILAISEIVYFFLNEKTKLKKEGI